MIPRTRYLLRIYSRTTFFKKILLVWSVGEKLHSYNVLNILQKSFFYLKLNIGDKNKHLNVEKGEEWSQLIPGVIYPEVLRGEAETW